MNITKSTKGQYNFIYITQSEMDAIYDAFNNARVQFTAMIQMEDDELIRHTGVHEKHMKELRDVLQDKVDFYEKTLNKVRKHVKR